MEWTNKVQGITYSLSVSFKQLTEDIFNSNFQTQKKVILLMESPPIKSINSKLKRDHYSVQSIQAQGEKEGSKKLTP